MGMAILRGLALSKKTALTKPPLANLQEAPWHPLTKCIPCSSEIGENDYAKGAVLCDKCKRLKTGEDFNDDGDSS
jgi:hypothetical protein